MAGQGDVTGVGAVPVEDSGHPARAPHAASGSLTELGARLGDNADLGHGGGSLGKLNS
jgi:hypothetical protein